MSFFRWLRLLLVVGSCWAVICALGPVAAAEQWVLPLAGEPQITRPFDPPATPYGPGHRGVDLAGSPGQVVGAAGQGTIGYAAPLAGRGVVTVLHDGGLRTTYEPVTASVVAGQAVVAGEPIGTLEVGHPECPVAACLHWGLRQGEVYLDPMSLLQVGPVRLLPRAQVVPPGSGPTATGPTVTGPTVTGPTPVEDPSGHRESAPPVALGSEPDSGRRPVVATTAAGLILGAAVLAARRPAPP